MTVVATLGGGVRSADVSLRGPKEKPAPVPTKLKNFRISFALDDYLDSASREAGQSQQDFITQAIELDRDLSAALKEHAHRLDAYAEGLGMSLERDLPRVLAQLVVSGLDALEQKKPGKK